MNTLSLNHQTIHISTADCTVFHEPDSKIICLTFKGNISSSTFRSGFQKTLEIASKEQAHYWLADNTEAGYISHEDQIWTNEVIAPAIAKDTNLLKMAFIEPKHMYNRMILEDMITKAANIFPFPMQFFENEADARHWFNDDSLAWEKPSRKIYLF